MTKYKALKSVAQEIGQWFLSDKNSVDSFKTYVPETLFTLAREHELPRIQIDFVKGVITPTVFAVGDVLKSVTMYKRSLPRVVESLGGSWDTVRAAGLELVFDLPKNGRGDADAGPIIPSFKCNVRILDDQGVEHVAKPTNWCR